MAELHPDNRVEKFTRVLGRMRLDRPAYVQGTPINVEITEPLDERCDVLARLVHESGRTYAQHEIMVSEETDHFTLGKALNVPDGNYEVVLTPPLGEFYSLTPYERRLPCIIGPAPSDDPDGTIAESDQ